VILVVGGGETGQGKHPQFAHRVFRHGEKDKILWLPSFGLDGAVLRFEVGMTARLWRMAEGIANEAMAEAE
jgi:hypothetical protein